MPEGVEVKIITEQLDNFCSAKIIKNFEIIGGRYKSNLPEGYLKFQKKLPIRVLSVQCKGKFIFWSLAQNWFIFNTLGMTGEWSKNSSKHSVAKVQIDTDELYFNDTRHFGSLKFVKDLDNGLKIGNKLISLGPDLLSNPPSLELFDNILDCNKPLPEILMNQNKLSGIGNYIKAETLYLAKLSPWRLGNSLSLSELQNLYNAIQTVMKKSYELGGATLATYKNFEGNAGKFAKEFSVYGKVIDPNGLPVLKELTKDKRTTHWVKEIQK